MDAKNAIAVAKQHVADVFGDELTSPPTLEEIWFDERKKQWFVTLGVRRSSNHVEKDFLRDPLGGRNRVLPDYKVLRIADKDGSIVSMQIREPLRA